jgi:23S rRNA pseudouridine1911/1915/1917 synthase
VPEEPLTVPFSDAGARLDRWLAARLGLQLERSRWLIDQGRVRIRGKTCSTVRKLFGGEEVAVELPPPRTIRPGDAAGPDLPILHDDAACLVVDKRAGLPVEPVKAGGVSVVSAVSRLGGFDVAGRNLPGLPHRLDAQTSGCLMLARTDLALQALRRAFEEGQVEKEYLALVAGAPPEEQALDTPYGRDPRDARRFTTRVRSARRARLAWRVERRLRDAALLRVTLDTGRTHQIRVQLAEAGFPVLGDLVYGLASELIPRQGLHATRLAFPSPAGGRVDVTAPIPADLAAALAALAPRA